MKRTFAFVLLMMTALCFCTWAQADEVNLPAEIIHILHSAAWEPYEIGHVNYGKALLDYDSSSCYYYDQKGYAAAFILMHGEREDILCVFEKNSAGEWYLMTKSADAVLQNGRIPLITAETYNQFTLSYLDDDRQSDLDLTFTRRQNGWFVTHISTADSHQQGTAIDVYENKLVFSCEKSGWQTTTIAVATSCCLAQFTLRSFPLTMEDAIERLSSSPDAPASSQN